MTKRSALVLTLAAVLLTALSLVLSRRDSEDWRATRSRRLFPFPWRDVASVRIERPDGSGVEMERTPDGEWALLLPDGGRDDLDPQAAEELSALVMLPWRVPLPGVPPPVPAESARLTAVSVDEVGVEVVFGKVHNGLLAVSAGDDPGAVFGVVPDLARVVDWPVARFRSLNLAAGPRPSGIVLSPAGSGENGRIELVRTGDSWRLAGPVDWPADPAHVDRLLGWIERLRADAVVSERVEDSSARGFGPDSAFVEARFDDAARPALRVEFGGPVPDDPESVFVRSAGRAALFTIPRFVLGEAAMDRADFYRLRVLDVLGPRPPLRLVVERLLPEPERLIVERSGAAWTGILEKGGGTDVFPVEAPSPDEPLRPLSRVFAGLSELRVRRFLADAPPGPGTVEWTAYPAWRFEATAADGTVRPALVLYASGADGGLPPESESGPVASLDGLPAVVELSGDLADALRLPPYRYRSNRLLDHDVDSWKRVVVERSGGSVEYVRAGQGSDDQWWRGGESGEPLFDDNNRFAALLLALSRMRAAGLAADADADPGEFGLDRPEITVIVYGTPDAAEEDAGPGGIRRLFKLTVGSRARTGEDACYARLDDGGVVFLLPDETAMALREDFR